VTSTADQNPKEEADGIKNMCEITAGINAEKFKPNGSGVFTKDRVVDQELEVMYF
jgi:hypothetical protein